MTNVEHCENLVRDDDKDRFLAALFAPAADRAGLFSVYAFDIETAAVAQRIREPMAGEIRLQWWHDALSGEAEAAGHPVADALLETMKKRGIDRALALSVIEARRHALYAQSDPTESEFELSASQSAGAIFRMAALALQAPDTEALRLACHHAGVAALAEDRAKDRVLSLRHREAVKSLLPALPEAALPALLPLTLWIEDRASLPQWRKQWILWRASKNLAGWL